MKKLRTKKVPESAIDDMLPEYNFSRQRSRPNKYAARYAAGGTVVVLDAELSKVFPDAASVNRALRVLADTATAALHLKKPSHRTRR